MNVATGRKWLAGCLAILFVAATGCGAKVNPSESSSADASTGTSSMPEDSSGNSSGNNTTESSGGESTDSSQGTVDPPDNSSGGNTTSSTIINSNTSSGGFQEPVYDLGGRVITIGTENAPPDLKDGSIFSESILLTQKKYNCTFKIIQKSDYAGLYQTMINDHAAGKASFDVVILRGYDVWPNAANSGAILELNKYYDFDADPTWQKGNFKEFCTFKGKWYGIAYTPNEMGSGIWYNRALLRAANVPDLWTYVENDTWNWNTFRAVCKKLTRDTNGDGKPDIWAFTSEDPWLAFINSNNANLLTTGLNGQPKFALDSKNALDAIQFVSDLHLVDNTVPDGAELGAITNSPFNAMTTGKVAMFNYHARYGEVLRNYGIAAADIGWVYMPKGPAATEYSASSGTMPEMMLIPSAADNPKELIAAVQDLAAYWDDSRAVKRQISDKTEELYKALSKSVDANAKKLLLFQAQNPVFTLTNNYSVGNTLQNELWPMILRQEKTVSSAVQSMKSKIQSELTTKYNGQMVGG